MRPCRAGAPETPSHMTDTWSLRPQLTPSPELVAVVGGHPLVARILAQRNITAPAQALAFLDPTCYTPAPPSALFGVDAAAASAA